MDVKFNQDNLKEEDSSMSNDISNTHLKRGQRNTRMYEAAMHSIVEKAREFIEQGKVGTGFTLLKVDKPKPHERIFPEF